MQAVINAQLAQERLEIVQAMNTLQSCYRGSDPGILAIVNIEPHATHDRGFIPGLRVNCSIEDRAS